MVNNFKIVKCHRCKHIQKTKSKMRYLTCSCCQTKTKNIAFEGG